MSKDVVLLDKEIQLDNGQGTIRVLVDKSFTKNMQNFFDSLSASRKLNINVDASHVEVLKLIAYSEENVYIDKNNLAEYQEFIRYVVDIVKESYATYAQNTQMQAVLVAMLNSNFSIGLKPKIKDLEIEIPDEHWNEDEVNAERLTNLLPSLPKRNKFNPIEQKVALINILLEQNPRAAIEFNNVVSNVFENLLARALMESQVQDENGFRPQRLD